MKMRKLLALLLALVMSMSLIACGGSIGPIIPPSIPLLIYGTIASVSVGKLFIGGFIPGIRPGKPTSDYITKTLNRVTLIGALFLGFVSAAPVRRLRNHGRAGRGGV